MADLQLNPFPEVDPTLVATALSSPPFVEIDGVFNVRDFGAEYPVSTSAARVKPRILFRSGEVARITDRGIEQLRALGIRKVFDLRVDEEIAKYKTANNTIEGVEVIRAPIVQGAWDPAEMAVRLEEFENDEAAAFMRMYTQILECGSPSLEKILLHLRDHPDEPCLMHCTAGKDRTGVFSAVILTLLGARDEDIVADYALTGIGMQPVMPMLTVRFGNDPVFRAHWAGLERMGSAKPQHMQAVLDTIRREHGGIEAYLKKHTSLVDEDFALIRRNFLV